MVAKPRARLAIANANALVLAEVVLGEFCGKDPMSTAVVGWHRHVGKCRTPEAEGARKALVSRLRAGRDPDSEPCYAAAVAYNRSLVLPRFGRGPLFYCLAIALLNMLIADQPYATHLVLGPGFAGGEYWQPLSSLFLFPEGRIEGLIGTFLIQWVIGTAVEDRLGRRRYFALLIGAGLTAKLTLALLSLAWPSLLEITVGGSLPGDLAAVIAFGVLFAERRLSFFGALTLSSRTLALIIAGLALLAPPLRRAPWSMVILHAVAMTVAYLAIARPWRPGAGSGTVGGRRSKKRKAKKPKKKHLRLVN